MPKQHISVSALFSLLIAGAFFFVCASLAMGADGQGTLYIDSSLDSMQSK